MLSVSRAVFRSLQAHLEAIKDSAATKRGTYIALAGRAAAAPVQRTGTSLDADTSH